jgi:hypothetical protein
MKKIKAIYLILAIFSLPITKPQNAKAADEFKTRQELKYVLDNKGQAKVEHNFWLINNFSNIYPKELAVSINSQILETKAWDEKGDIFKSQDTQGGMTTINLQFNKESVGKGSELEFHLSYIYPNFAEKKGQAWEIIVPKPKDISSLENYTAEIFIPPTFNNLAYASIEPSSISQEGELKKIFFEKDKFASGPIILAFANFQAFNFDLEYYLSNENEISVRGEIPLPPETNYQEVFFSTIQPTPNKTRIDENSNWLAEYILGPGEKLKVIVQGQAKVYSDPSAKKFYNLEENLGFFLAPTSYWPFNEQALLSKALELKTVKNIYNFVVQTLEYDYERASSNPVRMGGLYAINNPRNAVCTEFTDLFISLARAAGIPAREIEGYAYTNNPQIKPINNNVLHAWPEYWDNQRKIWVQVDPTWQKTTGGVDYFSNLDLNHLTLVIHGSEDNHPAPPGSYIERGVEPKVKIEFADNVVKSQTFDPSFEFNHELEFYDTGTFVKKLGSINFYLKNEYPATIRNISLKINTDKKTNYLTKEIALLPPFGGLDYSLSANTGLNLLLANNFEAELIIDGQTFFYLSPINNTEKFYIAMPYLIYTCLGILLLSLIIILSKYLVSYQTKKN